MLRILASASIAFFILSCERSGTTDPQPPKFQADFPSAAALNARLGKGVNLGNALDAPKEGDWGVTLKSDYFRRIADSGFNTVRIPVRFSGHALADSPYTIDSVFMNRVAWAVDQALLNKLNVVLDMHHYDSLMAHPKQELPRFLSLWKQICARFRDSPPEVLFELLNEPQDQMDAATWNRTLAQAIDTIRVLQPGRTLVVGTTPWGGTNGLGTLQLPADSNLIVTVHYYEPHDFTHQGADFEPGADQWKDITWRATPAQRAAMDQDLDYVRSWATEHARPIFMGEFGTYHKADSVSRALWTEYLTRKLDTLKVSWALWNFSSDFGIMNDTTEAWKKYLMGALMRHGQNPLLDSILGATKPIDVSTYVTWDDFEDSLPLLPATARRWREQKGIPLTERSANWYVFTSDSTQVLTEDGTRLHTYQEVDSGATRNFPSALVSSGAQGKELHVRAHLLGGNYPYFGLGAGILGGWDSTFTDLTNMTAIQFRAKGRGEWMIQMISDSINADTVENWGHMSYAFRPKADWETYVIPAETLAPKRYSKQEKEKLTWADVRKKIIALEFINGQSYGKAVDTTLEIWIDDVRLIGVTNADLGM
jgi:aryl-phospho-beta-D-glucosidase BglC (GH1 family)